MVAFKKTVARLVNATQFNECVSPLGTGTGREDTQPRFRGARTAGVKHPLDEFFGADDTGSVGFSDEPRCEGGVGSWHFCMTFGSYPTGPLVVELLKTQPARLSSLSIGHARGLIG